ncbi:hypothetical protein ACFVT1_04660 [Streptomyces sp. NPDC057963]
MRLNKTVVCGAGGTEVLMRLNKAVVCGTGGPAAGTAAPAEAE